MGGEYLDILILAMLAAFIIYRLRSVLGRRTGHERQPPENDAFGAKPEKEGSTNDNVVSLPEREKADEKAGAAKSGAKLSPVEKGVVAIQAVDGSFDPNGFVEGAKAAFEMIVTSFAMGDLGSIKSLLTKEVYDNFSDAVEARLQAKETLETTVVGFNSASIAEAQMDGRNAVVTVRFVSEQINATRDRNGEVIVGDPEKPIDVTDLWTFTRDTRSRDPNWLLVETGGPA